MRQVETFKALRPVPRSKRLRNERERAALQHDITIALQYAAMQRAAAEHNVRVGAYGARASPAVH